MVEVKVPEVGESVTEGVLVAWLVEDGSHVDRDDELFELETDKITVTVNAEESGKIELMAEEEDTVEVGSVVAKIDTEAEGAKEAEEEKAEEEKDKAGEREEPSKEEKAEEEKKAEREEEQEEPEPAPGPREVPVPESRPEPATGAERAAARRLFVPPSVRRLIREHDIDPDQIDAAGERLTKSDVIRHINLVRSGGGGAEEAPSKARPAAESEPAREGKGRQTRSKMSSLRKRIAERLVQAQQSSAILTTFNEADMSNLMAWRERHKEAFKEEYGIGLGFMSFFVKAAVDALKTVPEVNRQIEGDEIVQNHYYDIGIAVSTQRGLVVPVLRECDRLSFAEVETGIADLAQKTRDKKIGLDELSGGVFTISNGGVFGSLLSTPILNPPQSGVLGMHAIKKRPVAVGDQMELRPMMYLALSYDHRIIDGREAVTFLKRIVECVEDPERMMLEI